MLLYDICRDFLSCFDWLAVIPVKPFTIVILSSFDSLLFLSLEGSELEADDWELRDIPLNQSAEERATERSSDDVSVLREVEPMQFGHSSVPDS